MEAKFSHLRVVDLHLQEQYQKGKKFALTMGIKAAKYERLLFTDADCEVPGKFWIRDMLSHTADKDIVLGYAPIKAKHNPLGAIVFYETFHTALQYLSYALNGLTYMGVGRNLSYKKQLFFRNKGFASHQHLLSGDDDLFIQEVASRDNVAICITPETFMESVAPKNFSSWIRQKQRHTSTADLYKAKFKWLLAYYSFAQILFYLCIALNIFFPDNWYIAGGILLLKWLVQWTIFYKPALKLNAKRIAIFLPFYDFYYTGYLLLLGLVKPFYRGKTWM
jgi:hypothetical protein